MAEIQQTTIQGPIWQIAASKSHCVICASVESEIVLDEVSSNHKHLVGPSFVNESFVSLEELAIRVDGDLQGRVLRLSTDHHP